MLDARGKWIPRIRATERQKVERYIRVPKSTGCTHQLNGQVISPRIVK